MKKLFLALVFCLMAVSQLDATVFTVINTNDSGAGSLRQAILGLNAAPDSSSIEFNIGGGGVQTIAIASPLPTVTNLTAPLGSTFIIDGTTQPGFAGTPLIVIRGRGNAETSVGLDISINNMTVQSLVINNFANGNTGIALGGNNNNLFGCFIGTDPTGTIAVPNSDGVLIDGPAANRVIGGPGVNEPNLISGNEAKGVRLNGLSAFQIQNTIIQSNLIGVNITGQAALPNGEFGILLDNLGSSSRFVNTLIGGSGAGEGNVISGNLEDGIQVRGGLQNSFIQGNHIGTDVTNSLNLRNHAFGINFLPPESPGGQASIGNLIGGTGANEANFIVHNSLGGIRVDGDPANPNVLNAILENPIFNNGGNGIILTANGNHLQPAPVVNAAAVCTNTNTLTATVTAPNSPAVSQFRLELFGDSVNNNPITEGEFFIKANSPVATGAVSSFSVSPVPLNANFVSATATNLNNGGAPGDTSQFSLNVPVASTTLSINLAPSSVGICEGQSVDLMVTFSGGTAPFNLTWSDGLIENNVTSPHIRTITPAVGLSVFSVTLTDASGCFVTSNTSSINVSQSPTAVLSIISQKNKKATLQLVITGTGPFDVVWSDGFVQNGVFSPVIRDVKVKALTTFFATVTQSGGTCQGTSNSVTVGPVDPLVRLRSQSGCLCCGREDLLTARIRNGTAPFRYKWSDGLVEKSLNDRISRTVTLNQTTVYNVKVTDANGAKGQSNSLQVKVCPKKRHSHPRV